MIKVTFGRISKYTGKVLNVSSALFDKEFNSVEEFVRFKINCRYAVVLYYTGCVDRAFRHVVLKKSAAMFKKKNNINN